MSMNRQLSNHEHIHRFSVTRELNGWEVREEEDSAILKCVHRGHWQRVETDVMLFAMRADSLRCEGWIEN